MGKYAPKGKPSRSTARPGAGKARTATKAAPAKGKKPAGGNGKKAAPRAKASPAPEEGRSFLDAQRALLESLRAHLARRTDKVEGDLGRGSGDERDFEEQALARENDDVLAALSAEGRDQLAVVEAALARIASGSYGICGDCGNKVARARLEALPYATICVRCAATREKR